MDSEKSMNLFEQKKRFISHDDNNNSEILLTN